MTTEFLGAPVRAVTVNVGVDDNGKPAVEVIFGYSSTTYSIVVSDEQILDDLIFQLREAQREILG